MLKCYVILNIAICDYTFRSYKTLHLYKSDYMSISIFIIDVLQTDAIDKQAFSTIKDSHKT